MVKLKYYIYGEYKKTIKISDKKFSSLLLNNSLVYSHQTKTDDWFKDCGLGSYCKNKE